jgi:hypothetical protein
MKTRRSGLNPLAITKVFAAMPRFAHRILVLLGLAFALTAGRAVAQDNFDAGKTPAQLFANDCSGCHKSPAGLSKAPGLFGLESYLREHYTASRQAAAAIAGYLRTVDAEQEAKASAKRRKSEPSQRAAKRQKKEGDKAESKTEKKSEPKPEARSEAKSETKPETKPKTEPEAKSESKAEMKPAEPRAEAKPAEAKPAESKPAEPASSEKKD